MDSKELALSYMFIFFVGVILFLTLSYVKGMTPSEMRVCKMPLYVSDTECADRYRDKCSKNNGVMVYYRGSMVCHTAVIAPDP